MHKYLLIFSFFVTLLSCQHGSNDLVSLKVKILKISFNEDMYDDSQVFAYEEIIGEILNNGQHKNIEIINDDYKKMKTLKENQVIEIRLQKSDLNAKNINMNEIIWR